MLDIQLLALKIKFKLDRKSSSSNLIFQTGILQKSSPDRWGKACANMNGNTYVSHAVILTVIAFK